jgi:hypothetical protein
MQNRVISDLTGGPDYFNAVMSCALPPITGTRNLGTLLGNASGGGVFGPRHNNLGVSQSKLTSTWQSQSLKFRAGSFRASSHPHSSLTNFSVNVEPWANYGHIPESTDHSTGAEALLGVEKR